MTHVKDLQDTNRRHMERLEHSGCLATHLLKHGNKVSTAAPSNVFGNDLVKLEFDLAPFTNLL